MRRKDQIIVSLIGEIVENLLAEAEPGRQQRIEMRVIENSRFVIVEQLHRWTADISFEFRIADDAVIVGTDNTGRQHPVTSFLAGQQHIVEQAYFRREADRAITRTMGEEDQLWPVRWMVLLEKGCCGLRHDQRVEMAEQFRVPLKTAEAVERDHLAQHILGQPTPAIRADRPESGRRQGGIEKVPDRFGLPVAGCDDFDPRGRGLPLQRGDDRRDMGDLMQFVMIEQKADALGIDR